ncbi:hypothetical protein CYMTET_56367 [Cymbomonas tetramitiformis]|uniref:Uncharacterized protein n=1 Tax=Cymbomonas tetramitiformis TaxID=36881 RepID=A0AAE0ELW2_9CHLO|nr:hypothetical protein CYMTET_56367 [Cymbomonas tetramitiformis]
MGPQVGTVRRDIYSASVERIAQAVGGSGVMWDVGLVVEGWLDWQRVWEDAFEEIDYATQDGLGGGAQESGRTQLEQSEQASGGAGEAGAIASRLLESMEDVRREAEHLGTVGGQGGGTAEARSGGARAGIGGLSQAASSVQDILMAEWDDLSSPSPESGVWTQEQSGASPEQAMALAEGGVATLMGASRRVAGLLGGVDGMGGTDEDDGGDVGRSAGGVDTRRAPQSPGAHPGSDDHLQQAQVGGGCASLDEGNPVYHSQPLGTALGHSGRGVETQQQCAGRTAAEGLRWPSEAQGRGVVLRVGLVVEIWLAQLGGRDEPASGTSQQCAGVADADGLGWLSEA